MSTPWQVPQLTSDRVLQQLLSSTLSIHAAEQRGSVTRLSRARGRSTMSAFGGDMSTGGEAHQG
jgi:hypothetical protein